MKNKNGTKNGVDWWISIEGDVIVIFTQKKGSREQFRAIHTCEYPKVDRKHDPRDVEVVEKLLAYEIKLTGKGK